MHILITADPELPVPPTLYGGIERVIDLLIKALRAKGHTVGLVAHPDSTCAVDTFFPWTGASSRSLFDTFSNTITLWSAVQQFQPDVLHSFSRLQYLLPLLPSSLPKIMSYQRQPTARTVGWAAKIAGRSLTFTGCSSHICQQGQAAGGSWFPIHNFVDLKTYTFQANVAADAPLVFLSRVERIKGAHTAIAIARRANRRLIIAGNRVDSPEGARYWAEEIAPHLNQNDIKYIGAVNDSQKSELLGQAAAMLVPIEWDEPFGIVFAEALACGTPVISCARGALPEIVRPGIDGFLIRSIEDGCAAVEKLSQLNRYHCRQRAEQNFSVEAIVNQYQLLYQQVSTGAIPQMV